MQIDRDQFLQEQLLRKQIRKAIGMVKERLSAEKREQISEELKLRKIIRRLIQETTVGEAIPERATGINELERVLEEIIKILQPNIYCKGPDYKNHRNDVSGQIKSEIKVVKKIKNKSIKKGIDPKITRRIWKAIIWSYVDFQKKNFRKK